MIRRLRKRRFLQANEAVFGPSTSAAGRRRFKLGRTTVGSCLGNAKLSVVPAGIWVKEKGAGETPGLVSGDNDEDVSPCVVGEDKPEADDKRFAAGACMIAGGGSWEGLDGPSRK